MSVSVPDSDIPALYNRSTVCALGARRAVWNKGLTVTQAGGSFIVLRSFFKAGSHVAKVDFGVTYQVLG